MLALGHNGNVYRRLNKVWSVIGKADDGAYGLSYRSDVDKVFIASKKTISEYSPITSSPSFKLNKYGVRYSTDSRAYKTGGLNSYGLKTAIFESLTDKQEFQPDIEPLSKIRLNVRAKGTGDWTVTVHDALNTTLGTSTIAAANMTNNTVEFTFDPIRMYIKPNARTYHFHVTSTVADGSIFTETGGNMNQCDYEIGADLLIEPINGMHPIQTFQQFECIGNSNYLAVWEPLSDDPSTAEFQAHKLQFPANLEVCGITTWDQYLAIACEQSTSAGDAQSGYIFFWDGTTKRYTYFIKVPEGSPYALHEYKNVLYYYAGGAWYAYAGGMPKKLRTMPNTDSEFTNVADVTKVYPYMATVRRNAHLLGFPSTTTNQTIEYGVYSFGAIDDNFPDAFGYNYTMSSGDRKNTSGNLEIGMVKNFGDTLLMSWRNASGSYGVDVVDNTADPVTEAVWESLSFFGEISTKQKSALSAEFVFDELSDTTITPKYNIDNEGWVYGDAASTGKKVRININKRFYSIKIGFDLSTESSSPTVFRGGALYFDDLREESNV
jgi:hypothetical protein